MAEGTQRGEAEPWILTSTGNRFELLDPAYYSVRIEDIAHQLSLVCRFSGACRVHYSVAQHSVLVSLLVPDSMKLTALLHDAHEAYIGDFSSPLKTAMRRLGFDPARLADPIDDAIGKAFGVDLLHQPPEIRQADLVMLATEMRDLIPHPAHVLSTLPEPCESVVTPWSAEAAAGAFLFAFDQYRNLPR